MPGEAGTKRTERGKKKIRERGRRAGVLRADPPPSAHGPRRRRSCSGSRARGRALPAGALGASARVPRRGRLADPGWVWIRAPAARPAQLTAYFLPLVETASLSLFPATEFMVAFPEESVSGSLSPLTGYIQRVSRPSCVLQSRGVGAVLGPQVKISQWWRRRGCKSQRSPPPRSRRRNLRGRV